MSNFSGEKKRLQSGTLLLLMVEVVSLRLT